MRGRRMLMICICCLEPKEGYDKKTINKRIMVRVRSSIRPETTYSHNHNVCNYSYHSLRLFFSRVVMCSIFNLIKTPSSHISQPSGYKHIFVLFTC